MRIRICLPNCGLGIEAGVWGRMLLLILGSVWECPVEKWMAVLVFVVMCGRQP